MGHYQPLEIVKYQHGYEADFSIEAEYKQRLESAAAVVTVLHPLLDYRRGGKQSKQYPLFFVDTPEMVSLASWFSRNSQEIQKVSRELPQTAVSQFLDSLLLDEIINTNSIEGIEVDPAEVSKSIDAHSKARGGQFWPTVCMYRGKLPKIKSLRDFRNIYDELLKGEIPADKQPNGQLFRDELPNSILRIGTATKTVHVPPVSELAVSEALSSLLAFMNADDLPPIYQALVTHFFFENTHPFLDGNGRMGRYLLSTYLSDKYDRFTGFSVATAIHARISSYYRIFKEADKAENRAELTFFIEKMLRMLTEQQDRVLEALRLKAAEQAGCQNATQPAGIGADS